MTTDEDDTIHLKYGGSTAGRTLVCPSWNAMVSSLPEAMPTDEDSVYALEGKALHKVMETYFNKGTLPKNHEFVMGVPITPELKTEMVRPAIAALSELLNLYNVTDNVEMETFIQIDKDIGGTVDILARGVHPDTGQLVGIIGDYKFGRGHMINPTKDPQTMFYAVCAMLEREDLFKNVDDFVLAIIQPPDLASGPLKLWETTREELEKFYDRFMDAVDISDRLGDTPDEKHMRRGPHCRWCPASPVCPTKQGLTEAPKRFQPGSLTLTELSQCLSIIPDLEDWIRAVHRLSHELLERGDQIPHYKLVPRRAVRVYTDQEAVEELLRRSRKVKRSEVYDEKLKSPAQLETVFKEKGLDFEPIAANISKVSSGTTVVHESDPRKALPSASALAALTQKMQD